MDNDITSISANNELSFYTDKNKIPNQDLVKETIDYFESGQGARAFKPLYFLNLLERQFQFMKDNIKDGETVIQHIRNLPLNNLEQHILCGFLLKWTGGYPVNNLNEDFNNTLKQIQVEFLGYNEDTPEKEFCKANPETRKKFMMMGIALTNAINNNVSASAIMNAMPGKKPSTKVYDSFDALYKDASTNGTFGEFGSKEDFIINQSVYNFKFNEWLLEQKGWEYGNEEEYNEFLTKSFLIEFLNYDKETNKNENELESVTNEINFELTNPIQQSNLPQIKTENIDSGEQPSVKKISIPPLQYMEFRKSAFFSNLTKKNNFTIEDAAKLYQILVDSIKQLEQIRNDELLTTDFIEEKSKELFGYPTFDKVPNMWKHWLLKAISNDVSYVYAYNYLAIESNCQMHWAFYQLNTVSDSELYLILEKEKAQNQKTVPSTTLSEQPDPNKTQTILSLKGYKSKLDFTLDYYSEFSNLLIAINHDDANRLIKTINCLKGRQNEITQNETFLIEHVHFDLAPEVVAIYFNYAFLKLNEIIKKFNLHFAVSDNLERDDSRNYSMHKVWTSSTNSPKDHLFLNIPSPKSFIYFLSNVLESYLKDFNEKLRQSYLISFPGNKSVFEISDSDKKLKLINTPLNSSTSSLTDPNQVINNLMLLFEKFDEVNFTTINERKQEINLDVLTYNYSEDIHVLKKQILVLHLNSNTVLLDKVKSELIKKRNILIGMDFGFMPPITNSEKTKVLTDPDLLKMINDSKRLCLTELIDYIDSFENTQTAPTLDYKTETDSPKSEIKPIFKPEAIETIFDILKVYFPSQNKELKQVLVTGIVPQQKLIFQGSGKTLLDFFKQLMKGQFLTIAVQEDLLIWLSNSFEYLHRRQPNDISKKYASTIISGNGRAAKGNRLIDVETKNGKFEIVQREIRNREQN